MINSFCSFESGRDFMAGSLDKTLKSVFQNVIIHASGNGNVFFVAGERDPLKMLHQPNVSDAHPRIRYDMQAALGGIMRANEQSGIVLTDDYNPVEYHDAGNRERLRRSLAGSMTSP